MDREHYGEALFVPRKPTCLPSLSLSLHLLFGHLSGLNSVLPKCRSTLNFTTGTSLEIGSLQASLRYVKVVSDEGGP